MSPKLQSFLTAITPTLWLILALACIAILTSCAMGAGAAAPAEHLQAAADVAAAIGDKVAAGALTLDELVKSGVVKPTDGARIADAMIAVRDVAASAKVIAEQAKAAAEGKADMAEVLTTGTAAVVTAIGAVRAMRGKPTPKKANA